MPWFAYHFPCLGGEDLCKLGFSRDPLQRIRSLHSRWYEFFDLDNGLLVEAESERDARDLELALRRPVRLHNAPMPMTVRGAAGGETEWYRGVSGHVREAARLLARDGYRVHAPMSGWLRDALVRRVDLLFEWAGAQRPLLLQAENGQGRLLQPLLDELDAYPALSIPLDAALPDDVLAWYAGTRRARGLG
ncbi:GIY-YIG nuclease family protein [Luteimonas aquatica]|uniref:GIY-YIG nuclease family protein n=1 Tax=Luteimonas aquatica TaxID=450364 RepID=UPI001F57926E|nr:GIY-YIG nuclease family protein [Luteimonas aquatica]